MMNDLIIADPLTRTKLLPLPQNRPNQRPGIGLVQLANGFCGLRHSYSVLMVHNNVTSPWQLGSSKGRGH